MQQRWKYCSPKKGEQEQRQHGKKFVVWNVSFGKAKGKDCINQPLDHPAIAGGVFVFVDQIQTGIINKG